MRPGTGHLTVSQKPKYVYLMSVEFAKLVVCLSHLLHVWQSRVEIERYSVAYFDHITVLGTRYL